MNLTTAPLATRSPDRQHGLSGRARLTLALLITTLLLGLTACGFQLRGIQGDGTDQSTLQSFTPIEVRYPVKERQWGLLLLRTLRQRNIESIDGAKSFNPITTAPIKTEPEENSTEAQSPASGRLVIEIMSSEQNRRIASYTSRAKAAEYMLIQRLTYRLLNTKNEVIVPTTTLSSERVYQFNVNAVGGKYQEERIISSELKREISRRLIRSLNSLDVINAT